MGNVLAGQHEDLSSDPQSPCEKAGCGSLNLLSLSTGGVRKRQADPGSHPSRAGEFQAPSETARKAEKQSIRGRSYN